MKFTLEMTTDNAAFHEADGEDTGVAMNAETARILRSLAARLENDETRGRLIDANGNVVGQFCYYIS